MAISGRHCRSERAIVKRYAPPICHCEERSDVAISSRYCRSVRAIEKRHAPPICHCEERSDVAISGRHCRSERATVKPACTPDLSLRGAKRRGNLAVHAGTQESPGEFAGAYLRLPRRACALLAMTREGGDCKLANAPLRMGKGPQACHCEAPQEPRQSRSTRRNTGKPRRIR